MSLLDQFEIEEQSLITNTTSSTGYISADKPYQSSRNVMSSVTSQSLQGSGSFMPERKIFIQHPVKIDPPSAIQYMTVSNNIITLAFQNNVISRFDISSPDNIERYEFKKPDDQIHTILQDPTGQHLLVCFRSTQECYYITRNAKKYRQLGKMKGHLLECIGWNKLEQGENSTGPILIGTKKGTLFETEIDPHGGFLGRGRPEEYFTEVYQLRTETGGTEPVTGIRMEPFPHSMTPTEIKYFILVSTPSRIYHFIGMATRGESTQMFLSMFEGYLRSSQETFVEIPRSLGYSQLCVWPAGGEKPPKTFAWLTGAGIYYGHLDFGSDQVIVEPRLIPYHSQDSSSSQSDVPIAMCLTQFHCLVMYRDKLEALCVLNDKVVFQEAHTVRRFGPLISLTIDPVTMVIWTFTNYKVYKYTIHQEDRDVWKMYLSNGQFDLAKQYCKGNATHLNEVLTKHAEHEFQQGKFVAAARYYADSKISFEEVSLKFLTENQTDALKTFLQRKLDSVHSKDKTQCTMLTTWLVELYLNELGVLQDQGRVQEKQRLQREFHDMLRKDMLKECLELNCRTIYDLMASHGCVEDMVFFAGLMRDHERVINYHIQQGCYKEVLKVLTASVGSAHLFYKFSPLLMQHIPTATVDAWIEKGKSLEPKRLIPSLIQCNQPTATESHQMKEAIRYLEFCVQKLGNRETAIHNFILSLYAKQSNKAQLLKYLYTYKVDTTVPYDARYALRVCQEEKVDRACVHVYSVMGLLEEAVQLALTFDVDLAKEVAGRQMHDDSLQKKLWLRIAKHVIEEEQNINQAMKFLSDCAFLKIEDILPFFPDFVTIDQFKEAICQSLKEYNTHIENLKSEMKGATDSAKSIRADIHEVRNKYGIIPPDAKCGLCHYPLLTKGFYLFPCHHTFHSDCLITELTQQLTGPQRQKLEELIQLHSNVSASEQSKLKEQIDEIVCADCLFCGEIMIRLVDQPFFTKEEYEEALKSWR
ncbi:vacuolar protein sorting-associated protein 18 homolog [Dysidea avara]|uniref:vacuolar protein sorting-associated protein 18 homolog n=1 Tax=Dysidea avara TaxID=196820 RepID=UPI0033281E40